MYIPPITFTYKYPDADNRSFRIDRGIFKGKKVIHCIRDIVFPQRETVIISFCHDVVDRISQLAEYPDIVFYAFYDELVASADYVKVSELLPFSYVLFYGIIQIVVCSVLVLRSTESSSVQTVSEVSGIKLFFQGFRVKSHSDAA